MQSIIDQKLESTVHFNKWLRRACTTGFFFFLAKGLVWIVIAAWAIF